MNCRFCQQELKYEMVDLGFSPPSNAFLTKAQLLMPEVYYPLKIMVCSNCLLVQVDEFARHDDIFNNDYAYFSSYASSWLQHCEKYAREMIQKMDLGSQNLVVEIASNDGYLLQYFKKAGIPVLGIEPTSNTAEVAIAKGIPTLVKFFGNETSRVLVSDGVKADLLIGNNVLAHVPDINDFVAGMAGLLSTEGIVTMEFPHVLQLLEKNQFDTIYHEHFSYLSLMTVKQIFSSHGLGIFDVEEISTHGGSLRIYACHASDLHERIMPSVDNLILKEIAFGLKDMATYGKLQSQSEKIKDELLHLLIDLKKKNKKVAAYGAAAKGNTLLNFCGVRKDMIHFIADASPHKQNKFIPGMHIPVVEEKMIRDVRPDYVVILPWNLRDEIAQQLSYIRSWGGQFVTAIPEIKIF